MTTMKSAWWDGMFTARSLSDLNWIASHAFSAHTPNPIHLNCGCSAFLAHNPLAIAITIPSVPELTHSCHFKSAFSNASIMLTLQTWIWGSLYNVVNLLNHPKNQKRNKNSSINLKSFRTMDSACLFACRGLVCDDKMYLYYFIFLHKNEQLINFIKLINAA